MKFVIRDDDLNYFSQPSDIEKWYGGIFAQKIPVGFAAVPFVFPLKKSLHLGHEEVELKEYPIRQNTELVEYIKNNPFIEIMQHGYNHEVADRLHEYGAGAELGELTDKTLKGKKELEEVFSCDVNIFVPPHDRILNNGIKAVEYAGLNVIRGKGSKYFIFRKEYFAIFPRMVLRKLRYPVVNHLPAYPHVLDFGKHKEAYSYRLNDNNLRELMRGLDYMKKKNGNFIITAHIHTFNEKHKQNLMELIKRAQELKAEFVYPSDLFKNE